MKEIKTGQEVRSLLGEEYPKGKAKGKFPIQRHVVTYEDKKMEGLKLGSGLTKEQIFDEKARGEEYKGDVQSNPDYYKNEP